MSETRNRVEESYERMNDVAQVVDLVDHKDSVEESLENRLYTSPILFKDPFLNQILFSQPPQKPPLSPWRNRSKVRTIHVNLVICLNIGTDPPDVIKPVPCAHLECWIDPLSQDRSKAIQSIGAALQKQYEKLFSKLDCKLALDPSFDTLRRLCNGSRNLAKQDRVLFHYNGHGVPKPTSNGEIWVFNQSFTQYIPVSFIDILTWQHHPSMFIFDCSSSGSLIDAFKHYSSEEFHNSVIIMAACAANEVLPTNPNLPADLFTACLTTPIKAALQWLCLRSPLLARSDLSKDLIDNIPGSASDRKTPLGEIHWIFTAVTDTIAWNILSREDFQRLFREDTLVSSLFRNFLLADRIMRFMNCVPQTYPALPSAHDHPLWQAWDLAAEYIMTQVQRMYQPQVCQSPQSLQLDAMLEKQRTKSSFFNNQLTAFEVWLDFAQPEEKNPPEQLPIVLQMLLSQAHRNRAINDFARFMDLNVCAVNESLIVGITPYISRLLKCTTPEIQPLLIFIWAKIIAVDPSCKMELLKDNNFEYFITNMRQRNTDCQVMCLFILSSMMENSNQVRTLCLSRQLHIICKGMLNIDHERLCHWVCLCLSVIWEGYPQGKSAAIDQNIPSEIVSLFVHSSPLIRASACLALGNLYSEPQSQDSSAESAHMNGEKLDLFVTRHLLVLRYDPCPVVRLELIISLSRLVVSRLYEFNRLCLLFPPVHSGSAQTDRQNNPTSNKSDKHTVSNSNGDFRSFLEMGDTNFLGEVWIFLLEATEDYVDEVSKASKSIINFVARNAHDKEEKDHESEKASAYQLEMLQTLKRVQSLMYIPNPPIYEKLKLNHAISSPDGINLMGEDALVDDLPLKSKLLAFSKCRFNESMLTERVDLQSVDPLDTQYSKMIRSKEIQAKIAKSVEDLSHRLFTRLEQKTLLESSPNSICPIKHVLFHPTEELIATGNHDNICIWDIESNECKNEIKLKFSARLKYFILLFIFEEGTFVF